MSVDGLAAKSLLLVGYGNTSRRDDGAAAHILESLLLRLGMSPEVIGGDDDIEPGPGLKVLFLHQLAPELAELVAQYDTVVFIDAHVDGAGWAPLCWQPIEAAVEAGMVGHHLKPSVVVALAESLYGARPDAFMLSVLGHDFNFGEELSPETQTLAQEAVDRLVQVVHDHGRRPV
ncbi:MAG: hydrogenase maturation protease [Chloroflexi bacterium]|nr:hydrogenase maturation protease [Chloroflexota bacterium]